MVVHAFQGRDGSITSESARRTEGGLEGRQDWPKSLGKAVSNLSAKIATAVSGANVLTTVNENTKQWARFAAAAYKPPDERPESLPLPASQ